MINFPHRGQETRYSRVERGFRTAKIDSTRAEPHIMMWDPGRDTMAPPPPVGPARATAKAVFRLSRSPSVAELRAELLVLAAGAARDRIVVGEVDRKGMPERPLHHLA